MPKQKSHSGAKKRFTVTGSGKIKRAKMNRRHILTKKASKRKRALRKTAFVSVTQEKTIRNMI
ncbi:MAG: 50S ribosomal protein L35 [Clostridia bacterium]|nr:50S ribosomal protein L35 [Clostridia bacterium]